MRSPHAARAVSLGLVLAAALVVATALPAAAHSDFEPAEAAPGSTVRLTLFVEDERANAGTVKVQLALPATPAITVAEVPPVQGWATTIAPASGTTGAVVTWQGGPEPGDVRFPIVIGPLPTTEQRLQFKVVQTYDDGSVERWIDDFPAGSKEPPNPGPVLDLKAGAAGDFPTTTSTPATTAVQETTSVPIVTLPPTTLKADDSGGGGSSSTAVIGIVIAAIALAAIVGVVMRGRTRAQDEGAADPD